MSTELAVSRPLVKASTELSIFLGMEAPMMIETIKAQCFKGKRPDEVTDAQLATYISVANALKLNPLLPGQMYPYPDRNGSVTVMIGPDGVFTLLSNHPDVVAQKDGGPAFWTEHGIDGAGKETCTGYINHRTKGMLKKTIWVDEWVVSSNPNWSTRRHHMSEVRALKQVSRMVIHSLPVDSDEHKLGEMMNVTDSVPDEAEQAPAPRPAPPKRAPKGAAAVQSQTQPAAIEAEIVPPKNAADVAIAQGVQTAKELVAEKAADSAKPEIKPDTPPQTPAVATPKTALAAKEEFSGTVTVEKVFAMIITLEGKPTPSVQAKVSGAFTGDVYHFGGAALSDDGPVASPPWKEGATVKVDLFGRLNSKSGKVMVVVKNVSEASPATPAVEVD